MGCTNSPIGRAGCAGALLLVFGCSPKTEPAPQPVPPVAEAPSSPTVTPVPPPLGRADLLAAIAEVSAATAGGGDYPELASSLGGRRFSLRLPFGCGGRANPDASLRFVHNAERGTLQLSARPQVWTETAWMRSLLGGEAVEAIEGFWLSRPWLPTENCPVQSNASISASVSIEAVEERASLPEPEADAAPVAAPPPPASETVALVRVFEANGSRLLRRGGRPYEVTRKLDEAEAPGPQGYRLVLQGRIAADRQPIRCRYESMDRRPVCVVEMEFDRIAFEDPAGKTLADWRD